MHPARACPLAIAVALGAPAIARAQTPAPTQSPAYAPAPAVPAPASPSAPAAPAGAPAQPDDVAPVPPPPADEPAPLTAPIAPSAATPPPAATPPTPVGDVASPPPADRTETIPPLPRLSLTIGGVFGPHAHGEAGCQMQKTAYECQHTGNFLGLGGTIELRAQLYRILFIHARGLLVGNLRQRGVHRGLAGGGIGLGVYSRFAFVRAEYMLVPTLGSSSYYPVFYDKPVARDTYGLHAGMVSAGVRKYISGRSSLEAWGGLMFGPHSSRETISSEASEERTLITFMFSLAFTYDVLPAKGYVPQPRKPRQPRKWGQR